MKELFQSASKIVFMMLATTACVALFCRILDAKDFMYLAAMAFVYYFTRKKEEIK